MKKFLFLLSSCVLIFASCKKSSSTNSPADFLILTTGSNFTYQNTSGSAVSTFKLTVKGTDSTINNKPYKILTNSNGPNNYWFKSGTDYYRYGVFAGLAAAGGIEELYVKDAASNTVWTNIVPITYMGTPLNITAGYKITEIDISKTVATKVYTGVTHVVLTLNTTFSGFPISLGGGDFYYARGVGLINYNISVGNTTLGIATTAQNSDLISYEIK